jgi:ABC-2 type transport system ATP-binding protein
MGENRIMIEVDSLSKFYGNTRAIDRVSFRVEEGEILGFLGPNGAGKTTTMRILTCFTPPSGGRARIHGHDVVSDSLEVRRLIGYLPETVPLYDEMTVKSYLDFIADAKGYKAAERKGQVERVVAEVGLGSVAERLIGNLSKGYRQRVGLGQALIGDPKVLILDEPTIGLDPRQISEVRALIKSMARQKTVILSTHILPEVSMICSKVVIISEGRIVASGSPEKLTTDLEESTEIFATVRGDSERIVTVLKSIVGVKYAKLNKEINAEEREYLVGVERGKDVRAEISSRLVEAGFQVLELRAGGMSLEEIFLRVVAGEKGVKTNAA